MKTVIEPFRIKAVEPIRLTSAAERNELLQKAGYNLFQIPAQDVTIDFLTDSGTAALSSEQWSALMRADESYAGAASFYRFQRTVQSIFGFRYVLPVHQGRAGERLLFRQMAGPDQIVPSNTHFDTTRANIESLGAIALDLPCSEWHAGDAAAPFSGNIDLDQLEHLLGSTEYGAVPLALLTVTNNACAGQPVSMQNIKEASRLLKSRQIPLFIDAARFAENAYLIHERDSEYSSRSIASIAGEMFSYADGCLMSCKKDGIANIGGFIGLNDPVLAEKLKEEMIVTEGFPTYGGLSGRELETIAVGLNEALQEDYLRYREAAALFLHRGLQEIGVPVISPSSLHAVYVDAAAMFPQISAVDLPGQALACELYREAGIRSCEIGTAMFGKVDEKTGATICASRELVRLALPRRVYTQSHYEYVIEAFENILKRSSHIHGLRFKTQSKRLRHFTAVYEPVETEASPLLNDLDVQQFCPCEPAYEI
ncbi:MAG TPA: tryptophanase [Candidatus Melainabacteria bacterium]|nr:tryptophanase [Candidatus Melainabacteria bacterium]